MKINKYNFDANSNTHGIMTCVKESLKTEVIRVVRLPIAELLEIKIQTSLTYISIVLFYCSTSSSASVGWFMVLNATFNVFVNELHLLHPLSASEHTIILGDLNVNRNTTPSLFEKVVRNFKTNDLQQTNPTAIYGSTFDLVFTGGHLPSIIYNGCYYSDHMTLLIQKKKFNDY
jgi:exonuclease III